MGEVVFFRVGGWMVGEHAGEDLPVIGVTLGVGGEGFAVEAVFGAVGGGFTFPLRPSAFIRRKT